MAGRVLDLRLSTCPVVLGSMRSFCLGAEEPQMRYVDLDEAGNHHLKASGPSLDG